MHPNTSLSNIFFKIHCDCWEHHVESVCVFFLCLTVKSWNFIFSTGIINLTLKQAHRHSFWSLSQTQSDSAQEKSLKGSREQVKWSHRCTTPPSLKRQYAPSPPFISVKVFSDQICICIGAKEIGETRTVICLGMLNDPLWFLPSPRPLKRFNAAMRC